MDLRKLTTTNQPTDMTLTDPVVLPILLIAAFLAGSIGFITGATLRGIRARREQKRLTTECEILWRDRALLDRRDDTPLT